MSFAVTRSTSPLLAGLWIALSGAATAEERSDQRFEAVVQQHCASCHGQGDPEGDVNLVDLTSDELLADPELIRTLIDVLDTRRMPPEDSGELAESVRQRLVSDLRETLHQAVANSTSLIAAPIRRMNRFQYNNAVVDLFQLDCVVFTLPERTMRIHNDYFQPAAGRMPDSVTVGNRPLGKSQMIESRLAGVAAFPQDLRAEHGYDNRGDHLSLSPLLMESFLQLGQSITQSPDFGPARVGIWDDFFAAPKTGSDPDDGIRSRLEPFLAKAFRRPPPAELLDRYTRFVSSQVASGVDFTEAMKSVAAATISSPRFLYLYDKRADLDLSAQVVGQGDDHRGAASAVDDWELASRMSFFLWGSVPDETLLRLAAEGKLDQIETLESQIDRMLLDRKLKRFCDSFPLQWLQLDRILSSVPNREQFPDFYFSKYRASMHMMLEPLLLFETVLIEDRPITELIDPDFSYRSARLEQAYAALGNRPGKSSGGGVTVLTFHRIPLEDRRSGGVVTNAAVMTMTSGHERTKPITRGAWIAGVIFNDPPDPPPADVPPLPERPAEGEQDLTLRERLAAHRERADCRGCHEQIDPLGFAVENFDPVGQWRDRYPNGREIDVSGRLFGVHEFTDVVQFKQALLSDPDRFCRALAGHLLSFALARKLGPADELALDEITAAVAADDYKMKILIREIILSQPFRTKS